MLRSLGRETLITFPERGFAYYPVNDFSKYDRDYFQKYEGYARTAMGRSINNFRRMFMRRFLFSSGLDNPTVCDVGIGCGQFVASLMPNPNVYGFDVNPTSVQWLTARSRFLDPYTHEADVMTFWDSLEHIPDFDKILVNARRWVFISMPIFENLDDHLRNSKHYRQDEHFWYFTHIGLVDFMYQLGFIFTASSPEESRLGRDDIQTFAFRRA